MVLEKKVKRSNGWRTAAIIFMSLFVLETTLWILGSVSMRIENDKANECFYDICGDHPDALYYDNSCECYDYDLLGNEIVVKSEYMK